MSANGNGAPRLTADEKRRALIAAIAASPAPWICRELAETLAREEYGRGRVDGARRACGAVPAVGGTDGFLMRDGSYLADHLRDNV